MGLYRVLVEATGGHGCQREVEPGVPFYGCRRQDCPDCVTQEFIEKLKKINQSVSKAELIHWPNATDWGGQTITDTFVGPSTEIRTYESSKIVDGQVIKTGVTNQYINYQPIHRVRDKKF